MRLRPSEIRFSQDSISGHFTDPNHGTILDVFEKLVRGDINCAILGRIEVSYYNDNWVAFEGNRRLFIFKKLEEIGMVLDIEVKIVRVNRYRINRKYTTLNGGTWIRVRGAASIEQDINRVAKLYKTANLNTRSKTIAHGAYSSSSSSSQSSNMKSYDYAHRIHSSGYKAQSIAATHQYDSLGLAASSNRTQPTLNAKSASIRTHRTATQNTSNHIVRPATLASSSRTAARLNANSALSAPPVYSAPSYSVPSRTPITLYDHAYSTRASNVHDTSSYNARTTTPAVVSRDISLPTPARGQSGETLDYLLRDRDRSQRKCNPCCTIL